MSVILSATLDVLLPFQDRSRDVYGWRIYGSQGIFSGVMFHASELRSTAGGSVQENRSLGAPKTKQKKLLQSLTPASEGLGTQK